MDTRADIHEQFDFICAQVGDWEPLPAVTPIPPDEPELDEEEQVAPMNELILAGLVAPV
jgi:hypothetical protein